MRTPNYDKFPKVAVPGGNHGVTRGWAAIASELHGVLNALPHTSPLLAIECYPSVFVSEIRDGLQTVMTGALWIDSSEAMLSAAEVDRLVAPDLGGDDPVFGRMSRLSLEQFFDPTKIDAMRARIADAAGPVVVIGPARSSWRRHQKYWCTPIWLAGKRSNANGAARSRTWACRTAR